MVVLTLPRPARSGALLCGLLLLAATSACSSEPELADLDADAAATCERVIAALPDSLLGSDVTDRSDRVATYGDVEVTCGVDEPEDYQPTADCHEVGGVGWYVPAASLTDLSEDLLAVALSHEPYVQLFAPADQRLAGTDTALTELAAVLNDELGEGLACL
ncbi:MAG: DUF3515 family protein [Nocardioides sp.]|uniref:DUF3515 family protein n=1 Tax=Nocardioides sp. TaxID=35761 RepID=UPI003EFF4BC0